MMTRVIVVGAGIGGLTTAALLAKQGYEVQVLEGQTYPGGSASTYFHKGYQFDSGATVAGGFQPNGPHAILGDMLELEWNLHTYDPAWVVHMPGREIQLTQDNKNVLENFPQSANFWEQQTTLAELGWSLSAQGLPWPPTDLAELFKIAKVGVTNLPSDLQILPFAIMNTYQWMQLHGLSNNHEFVRFIDGQLLISAQSTSQNVYALYSATALDLARQGVYHAEGGIGGIAEQLVTKLKSLGGNIHYRQHVSRIEVENGIATGVYAKPNRRSQKEHFHPADIVIANVTPWSLENLLQEETPSSLKRENKNRQLGYGAFVLHLGLQANKLPNGFADHHQFLMDVKGRLGEGRSLFLSISPEWDTSRAPAGMRAATVTTHTNVQMWWDLLNTNEQSYYDRKEAYKNTILRNIEQYIPGFQAAVTLTLPGTPVTYAFYTDRHKGMVGGFPQNSLFKSRGPRTGITNVRLVGDSIFPGQSTAAVTLGAIRVAQDIQRNIPLKQKTVVTRQPGLA